MASYEMKISLYKNFYMQIRNNQVAHAEIPRELRG